MAENPIDRSEIDHVLELIEYDLTHQEPADSIITLLAEEPKAILAKNPHVLRQELAAVRNYSKAWSFWKLYRGLTAQKEDSSLFPHTALNTLERAAAELLVRLYALHSYGMASKMLPAAWKERGDDLKAALLAFVGERDAAQSTRRELEHSRQVKSLQTAAAVGLRVIRGGQNAAIDRHGTIEAKLKRWSSYQSAIEEMHASNPSLSFNAVCKNLCKRLGVCESTLKHRCKRTW